MEAKITQKRPLSPERKFTCASPGCLKSFTRRDYLSRHEANHSSVKPFPCIQCDLGFARKDLLEKHYKSQSHQRKRDELTSKTKGLIVNNLTPQMVQKKTKIENVSTQRLYNFDNHTSNISPAISEHSPINQGIQNNHRNHASQHQPAGLQNGVINHNNNNHNQTIVQNYNENHNINQMNMGFHPFDTYQTNDSYSNFSTGLTDNFGWLFGDLISENNTDFDKFVFPNEASTRSSTKTSPMSSSRSEYDENTSVLNDETFSDIAEILKLDELRKFTPTRFDEFLTCYWNKFNFVYPIIHYPTFDANDTDIFLLISMISIGMAYSSNVEDYQFSMKIHQILRNLLFAEIGDSVKVRLPLLQSILLDNFYCKLLGNKNQYQVSQLFHGTSISLLRFSGYLDELIEPSLRNPAELTLAESIDQWKEWIYYETCKRTALFGFICDAQHASLFRHNQLLSAFEIQLELPCTDAVWNSHNFARFYKEYERQPKELRSRTKPNWEVNDNANEKTKHQKNDIKKNINNSNSQIYSGPSMPNIKIEGNWPSFLWSLRRLMQPYKEHQKEYPMNCFSQFSRFIFLHGLLSIGWDLRWRGLLDLGIVSKKRLVDLSDRIQKSFLNWRGYFDTQITHTNNASLEIKNDLLDKDFEVAVLNDYGASPMFWANLTLFQMAMITLHVDTVSIIKLATDFTFKSNEIKNSPNKARYKSVEKTRNRDKIQAWTRSSDGHIAVIESCQFLNTIINNMEIIGTVAHIPWTIYIACLTIWCYETNSEVSSRSTDQKYIDPISSTKYLNMAEKKIDFELAKEDSLLYITKTMEKGPIKDQSDIVNNNPDKDYWKTQQKVLGLISFSTLLLGQCKWENMADPIIKLESLLNEYR